MRQREAERKKRREKRKKQLQRMGLAGVNNDAGNAEDTVEDQGLFAVSTIKDSKTLEAIQSKQAGLDLPLEDEDEAAMSPVDSDPSDDDPDVSDSVRAAGAASTACALPVS
jgi:hypothetical protein